MSDNKSKSKARTFKIVLVGDSGVGKSSLTSRLSNEKYHDTTTSTMGLDISIKHFEMNKQPCRFQFWDTGGQESFKSIHPAYYKNVDAILFVFDLSDKKTLDNTTSWVSDAAPMLSEKTMCLLVGTKLDLVSSAQDNCVSEKDAHSLALEQGMPYIAISAKENTHVNDLFLTLAEALCSRQITTSKLEGQIVLKQDTNSDRFASCCHLT